MVVLFVFGELVLGFFSAFGLGLGLGCLWNRLGKLKEGMVSTGKVLVFGL